MNHRFPNLPFTLLLAAALPAQAPAPAAAKPAAPAAAVGRSVDAADHLAMGKMWTFENPPLAYLEKEYGFKPDSKWLDSLRLAALRLGERENPWCSASFVSPRGLIMTNHHCVRDKLAENQGDQDWIDGGFAAKALADEVRIPGLTVQQLVAMEDVTAKATAGVQPGDDDATVARKREQNGKQIVADADAAHPGFLHQVVNLYQGAVVQLYRYRVYEDIRLVMAVDLQAASFGGDPDNFTYPRWDTDFAFVRAYENDEPADTAANYFRWRAGGAKEDELVFVPGNPGSTNRLFTMAQLELQRDVEYPLELAQWADEMVILRPFTAQSPQLMTTLLGIENSNKAVQGMYDGLRDPELMARKATLEQHFRAAVAADPALAERYGKLWDAIAEQVRARREILPRTACYAAGYSPHLERALAIVKAADPGLSAEDRKEARQAAEEATVQMNPLLERLLPTQFARTARFLPADDPFLQVLGGKDLDAKAVARKLRRSAMAESDVVKELLDGGNDAIAKSDDFAVQVARVLWPRLRDNEKRQKEVEGALATLGARLGQALHAAFGTAVSPDATMTLRFSDGIVKGYPYNGTLAPWSTTFYGLLGRAEEFGGKAPFQLAKSFAAAKDKIDPTTRLNFVSTNDIVGGNSGSCVVDRDLRVVGLIFDGNIESLPNDFYYTQEKARAVSVHVDAITAALGKAWGMERIVDELLAGAKAAPTGAGAAKDH